MFLLALCFETICAHKSGTLADSLPERHQRRFNLVQSRGKRQTLQNTIPWCRICKELLLGNIWKLAPNERFAEESLHREYFYSGEDQSTSLESQLGVTKVERTVDRFVIFDQVSSRYRNICIRSPVFWIDEETKEYIALCALGQWCVVYSKKGDTFWNQVPEISDCECMLYKNHKLYCISKSNIFTILDFSGQIPQQTFQCSMLPTTLSGPWYILSKRFVVTITGDVLMVEKVKVFKSLSYIESFRIFKIYSSSSGFLKKHERVESLGDETMVLDAGITVLANKVEGLQRNSIYFSSCCSLENNEVFIFDLDTEQMEELDIFDFVCSLGRHLGKWVIPSFT